MTSTSPTPTNERTLDGGALSVAATRFPELLDSLVDGVLAIAPGGTIVAANRAACALFGASSIDDLVGTSWADLLAEGWDIQIATTVAPGEARSPTFADTARHETLARRLDGSELPVELTWTPTADEGLADDDINGVHAGAVEQPGVRLVTIRDVTERRSWEDALRSSETLHRSLVGALDAGVMVFDRAGVILAANNSALRILAIEAHQIEAHQVPPYGWRFVDEAGQPIAEEDLPPMRTLRDDRPISNAILGIHTDDGDLRWVSMTSHPLRRPGTNRPYAAVASFTDVTDRRLAEQLKSEIISVVSHELRTPLASLRGSLGLVSGGAAGEVPEAAERLLGIALDNTDRLIRLLDDLLAVEKLESGTFELEIGRHSIDSAIAHVVEVLTPMADEAGIELVIDTVAVEVDCDADRIVQTLTNLVNNAIKFTENGSTVRITAAPDPDGRELLVGVHDRGPGIPEAQRERVFERFVQIGDAATGRKGGSGLGLAICRGIVEQHGGRIWVDSEPGLGSTFSFTLPLPCPDDIDRSGAPGGAAGPAGTGRASGTHAA